MAAPGMVMELNTRDQYLTQGIKIKQGPLVVQGAPCAPQFVTISCTTSLSFLRATGEVLTAPLQWMEEGKLYRSLGGGYSQCC